MTADATASVGETPFRIVARESGHYRTDLPVWGALAPGSVAFESVGGSAGSQTVTRADIAGVPGAFQLIGLLTADECDRLIEIAEQLGFTDDAPVSLGRNVRHNDSLNWIVDESVDGPVWTRCETLFDETSYDGARPLGLNARFRFYRYGAGDYFAPHTDGAWPGSRVIDGELIVDAYGDRVSQMTFLIFLSDGYEGGRTLFQTDADQTIAVATPKGAALCFPHGFHPLHCVHAGERVTSGTKYIIRTDVLYG